MCIYYMYFYQSIKYNMVNNLIRKFLLKDLKKVHLYILSNPFSYHLHNQHIIVYKENILKDIEYMYLCFSKIYNFESNLYNCFAINNINHYKFYNLQSLYKLNNLCLYMRVYQHISH